MAIYISGLVCQTLLEEVTSHALTAVRITDRVILHNPQHVPGTLLFPIECNILLSVRSESPQDKFDIDFVATSPSGKVTFTAALETTLEGGAGGFAHKLAIRLDPRSTGLWWFDVSIKGETKLRIPLEVFHEHPTPNGDESATQT